MLFNSTEFLIFFPSVFILYWMVLKNRLQEQNGLLLLASYFFYGSWDWRFLSLIIISSATDYLVGSKIFTSKSKGDKKAWLLVSLVINLGILAYFKYANFFMESLQVMAGNLGFSLHTSTLSIILPVGISFYTFQTMSYTIDIYRNQLKPTQDILSFFTFVAFFPQLVAGPIERAKHLLPQFQQKRKFNYAQAASGGKMIIYGLFKKIIIADQLATIVDIVYQDPSGYSGLVVLVTTLFFALQIYCDFSGYTDIAIGTARILGFDLMQNFNFPYFSSSFQEFWRRWHISLSTWFRDYVYIPLGGNKKNAGRVSVNLMITFLLSGLWHGAHWKFIVWGGLHGSYLLIERSLKSRLNLNIPKTFSLLIVFILVCVAWVFFRANTLDDAFIILNKSVHLHFNNVPMQFRGLGFQIVEIIEIVVFIGLFMLIEWSSFKGWLQKAFLRYPKFEWSYYYILLLIISFWGYHNAAKNFIYFQF